MDGNALVQHFRFLAGEHIAHPPMSMQFLQTESQLDSVSGVKVIPCARTKVSRFGWLTGPLLAKSTAIELDGNAKRYFFPGTKISLARTLFSGSWLENMLATHP